MIFWEIAKRNIRIHLLRSSLAMLGIVIGVVAIASMGILGNSLVLAVSDSLKTVGDSVIVTPQVGGTMRGFGGGNGRSIFTEHYRTEFRTDKTCFSPEYC